MINKQGAQNLICTSTRLQWLSSQCTEPSLPRVCFNLHACCSKREHTSHTLFLFAYKAIGFFKVFDIWAFQKYLFYLHENTWQEERKISLSLAQLSKGTQETGSQLQNGTPAAWSRWRFNVFLKGTSSGKILVIMRAFSSHSVVSQ